MTVLARILRILLAAAFTAMGVAHFVPGAARTMAAIIPPGLRGTGALSPESLVAFTGGCEIAGAAGLLLPRTRRAAGVALIVFLAAVFPANAYAAQHPDRFGAVAIPFGRRLLGQLGLMGMVAVGAFTPARGED